VTDGVSRRKSAAKQDQQPNHNHCPLSPQLALNKKVVTEPWSRLYKLRALVEKNAQSMSATPDERFALKRISFRVRLDAHNLNRRASNLSHTDPILSFAKRSERCDLVISNVRAQRCTVRIRRDDI